MLETVSTYRPRKATTLALDELSALEEALSKLASGEAVAISREDRDSEGKARTDALAVRKQWFTHSGGVELRTHVLEVTSEDGTTMYRGAVSNPLTPVAATDTDDAPPPELTENGEQPGESDDRPPSRRRRSPGDGTE